MDLVRATLQNGIFEDLEAQWKGQLAKYDEGLEDYVASFREHCRSVIQGNYDNYFVYVLSNGGALEGFLHVNYAQIKRLPGHTLRVLEIFLAPELDYEDITKEKMAQICAGVFSNLLELSNNALKSSTIKVHMGPLDKDYLIAFSSLFSEKLNIEVSIHGSWLVLKKQ